jgi:hypothetical protein
VLRRFTAAGEAKHSLEEVIAKMIYQSGPSMFENGVIIG